MDGLMQDLIIMLSFAIFGVIIIIEHFKVLNEIKYLKRELTKTRELSDLSKMQDDLMEFRQSLININAKMDRDKRSTIDTLDGMKGLIDILAKHTDKLLQFMDSCRIPSDGDVLHVQDVLDKMAEMGIKGQVKINPDEEANA